MNILRWMLLIFIMTNHFSRGYFMFDAGASATARLADLIGNSTSILLPNRLQDIENALRNGADAERSVPCGGVWLKPMEIALKHHDWNLVELLLRHRVPITGAQIRSTFIHGSHGINMPWLMKLVAATAGPEMAIQIRNELRSHEWFIAGE